MTPRECEHFAALNKNTQKEHARTNGNIYDATYMPLRCRAGGVMYRIVQVLERRVEIFNLVLVNRLALERTLAEHRLLLEDLEQVEDVLAAPKLYNDKHKKSQFKYFGAMALT